MTLSENKRSLEKEYDIKINSIVNEEGYSIFYIDKNKKSNKHLHNYIELPERVYFSTLERQYTNINLISDIEYLRDDLDEEDFKLVFGFLTIAESHNNPYDGLVSILNYLNGYEYDEFMSRTNLYINNILKRILNNVLRISVLNERYLYNSHRSFNDSFNRGIIDISHIVNEKYKVTIKDSKKSLTKCIFIKGHEKYIKYIDISDVKRTNYYKKNTLDLCYAVIKDYKESSDIFGYRLLKKDMFNSKHTFSINNISYGHKCKKDDCHRDIIELKTNNKCYKFVLSEVDIHHHNLNELLKGYNKPKDRSIKKGSEVKVVNNRFNKNIPYKILGKVNNITNLGSKKYASVTLENKELVNINIKCLKVK